jgi:phage shock protein C
MDQENMNVNAPSSPPGPPEHKKDKTNANLVGGIILITLGILFLFDRFFPRINFGDLWPVILVVIGIIMVNNAYKKKN